MRTKNGLQSRRQRFNKIDEGISYEDEDAKQSSARSLYIAGAPGSGKTAVLIEAAVSAAKKGMRVLIVAPTGQLVHALKTQLPDFDGVENIEINTIHGVLQYKRPGADSKVKWYPPSALRRVDLILIDEASQYDDKEWVRLFQCIKEQPQSPFLAASADFQQLQPLTSGKVCNAQCEQMPTEKLTTVYRTNDPEHLLFLNRIREEQPRKETIREYFGERHWSGWTLDSSVKHGMQIAKEKRKHFYWLTCTNAGASKVCEAALRVEGITEEELRKGYPGDPSSKSRLRIVAKEGILLRLTRNQDKRRGFVNGALAVVYEELDDGVIIAKLVETGNMVLIHPMEENGMTFLPCCYGYATTIRRAQGASLDIGCLYFDFKKHHAGRGYGYVGVSRFRSRAGVHLHCVLRQSDFLPVGADKEDEHWQRGYDSLNSSDSEFEGHRHMGTLEEDDFDEEYDNDDENSNALNRPADPEMYESTFNADFGF